jgi:FkbM family methyltransferase
MNFIKKIFHKIGIIIKTIFVYQNWFSIYLYYLKLLPKPYFIMKLRNGVKFKIRPRQQITTDSYIVHEIWLHGVHNALKPYLKNAKIGIEIGAHIGIFSVFAAYQSPDLTLYAFEPAANNLELLKENISLNHLNERILPQPYAICGTVGEREFYLPKESGLYSLNEKYAQNFGEYQKITVQCKTLENFFKEKNISFCDFIKMDCEGGEYEILYSAPEEILAKIGVMSIEYHKGGDVKELQQHLEKNGFDVTYPHELLDVILAVRK